MSEDAGGGKNQDMFDANTRDLELATDKIVSPLENKVKEFNKKAAGVGWNTFKRALATGSEPFFRKAMGERYFDRYGFGGGLGLWAGGTAVAYYLPQWRSLVGLLCDWKGYGDVAAIFRNPAIAVAVGGIMCVLHWIWGMQSMRLMAKYRAEEVAYHTRSRGTPRWGNHQFAVGLLIVCLLLIFNLPVAVLFIVAMMVNSNVRAEQQAAIMSSYLDALDKKLENDHLEDAALGKCPTEKTFLDQPISKKFKPEIRENIAAAMVGKPVNIVARAPKSKKTAGQKQPPPQPPTGPEPEQEPSPEPAQKKTESPTVAEEPAAAREEEPAPQPEEAQFDPTREFNPKAAARQLWETNPEKFIKLAQAGILIRKAVISLIVLIGFCIAAYGAFRFIQYHWPTRPPVVAQAAPQTPTPAPPPAIAKAEAQPASAPAKVAPAPQVQEPTPVQPPPVAHNDTPTPAPNQPAPQEAISAPATESASPEKAAAAAPEPTNSIVAAQAPAPVVSAPSVSTDPVAAVEQVAKIETPPEHTGGVKAEIQAFKDFQHYVVETFSTQQARIQQLRAHKGYAKLMNEENALGQKLQAVIDEEYGYVKDLRHDVPADEAAARSLPPEFASRQSISNALVQLQKEVEAAANQ